MDFSSVKKFLFKHYIFLLYSLMAFGLLIGLSQFKAAYSWYVLGLYLLPMVLLYLLVNVILHKKITYFFNRTEWIYSLQTKLAPQKVIYFFIGLIVALFLLHGLLNGRYPGFLGIWEFDYDVLVQLRKDVTIHLPSWFAYPYSITMKALIPFSILYAYLRGKKWQVYLLITLALLMGINAMQKSYFMAFFLPLALTFLFERKFKKAILLFVGIASCIFSMVLITNPALKYSLATLVVDVEETLVDQPRQTEAIEEFEHIGTMKANEAAVNSILLRTLYLPGKMVGFWFEAIPEYKPFLKGKGYRLYAKATGQEYHNYSLELYPVIFPDYAARGYAGSVNVTSFMYDYANWGLIGLPIGAIAIVFILFFSNALFTGQPELKVALNTMPVLMLSSGSYTTLLLSGGWGFTMLLFILLFKQKQPNESH